MRGAQPRAVVVCAGLMIALAGAVPSAVAEEGQECDGEQTDMVIEYGDLIQCAISPAGSQDVFRFVGSGGERIRIQIADQTDGAARPCFQLRDPDDSSRGRACGNRDRDFSLTQAGIYRIVVTEDGRDSEETVQYALVAERIDPTSPAAVPIEHEKERADQINQVGDLDAYFFEATAGDAVAIRLTDRTPGSPAPCFQLYGPDGAARSRRMCGSRNEEFALEETGRHSILVTERARGNQEEVDYRLGLSCAAGECPGLGLDEVTSCLTLRGAPLKESSVRFIQPGEERQTFSTNVRGCARFVPVPGKTFEFRIAPPGR